MAYISGYNNISFLEKLRPTRLLIGAFVIWSVLFFTSPLDVNIRLNYFAFVLIFCCIVAFVLGTISVRVKKKRFAVPKSKMSLYKLFRLVLILSVLGIALKAADRFFIRGISLDVDYFSNRESMEGGSGNVVAILASILAPFSYFPLFLMWKYKIQMSKIAQVVVFGLFVMQVFDSILLGSRSSLFVIFVFLLLYLLFFKKITLTVKNVIFASLFIFGFLYLMNYIFIERTKIFAGDKAYEIVLRESNFNYTVTSSDKFKKYFDRQSPLLQNLFFTYITTTQYFTHGMFEFSYLYDNFEKDHSLGSHTFSVYARFINKVIGNEGNTETMETLAPRTGVYTTLYGPLYLDFGWFVVFFMYLMGLLSKIIYEKAKNGSDGAILLYFYISVVLIFSPVFNFISGAGGIFLLTTFIIYYFLSKSYFTHEKVH